MRKIIHCDFDCFYAAIETRDNPSLQGKPIAIGGAADKRGVVATCSYEARKMGVRSAMATATALRLCPDLILIPPNMSKYREASQQAHEIFRRYSEIIEPLSLDEAFLDVSGSKQQRGSATLIAQALRKDIYNELAITASAGIAPNKFLAKIASDWNKPNGQFVVLPEEIDDFVFNLPVGKIFGVGKVTEQKMHKQNIHTCGDLRQFSQAELNNKFGKFGKRLHQLCRGIDERPVSTSRTRKSVSVERTFQHDLQDPNACMEKIPTLLESLMDRLNNIKKHYLISGVYIKVKFSDFSSTTVEKSGQHLEQNLLTELLDTALKRNPLGVRLIGIGVKVKPANTSSDNANGRSNDKPSGTDNDDVNQSANQNVDDNRQFSFWDQAELAAAI